MNRLLFGGTLLGSVAAIALSPSWAAIAHPLASFPSTANFIAQEPNQDNLQMTCTGSILVNDIDFTVSFTREAGFSQIELRRRSTGQQIANTTLSYDRTNDQGQAIWRGNVNNMADVTLVHLATGPGQSGDQVSVSYDGQWGRGTCRR